LRFFVRDEGTDFSGSRLGRFESSSLENEGFGEEIL